MRGQRRSSLALGLRFERAQDLSGSGEQRGGQTGQARDLDAIRAIGPAGQQLVQEHHLVLILTNRHLGITDADELSPRAAHDLLRQLTALLRSP